MAFVVTSAIIILHYEEKSLNCLNWATFRKLSNYNMRKKSLNFLNAAQLKQFSDFFFVVLESTE